MISTDGLARCFEGTNKPKLLLWDDEHGGYANASPAAVDTVELALKVLATIQHNGFESLHAFNHGSPMENRAYVIYTIYRTCYGFSDAFATLIGEKDSARG